MIGMFQGATSFNQNLSSWNVSNVTAMDGMFTGATSFSPAGTNTYLDQMLNSWAALSVQSNVTLDAPLAYYSSSGSASYNTLVNTYGWTINANGPPPPPPATICFLEGTKLLSFVNGKEEYVPIQDIRKGDLVKTFLNGYKPVDMIGHSKIYNPSHSLHIKNRLYKLSTKNYPELTEDVVVTGCHSVLVEELTEDEREKSIQYTGKIYLTEDKYRLIACLDGRAEPYTEEGVHTIWHLALENDDYYMNYGCYASGLLVETTSKRMMKELSGMELVE